MMRSLFFHCYVLVIASSSSTVAFSPPLIMLRHQCLFSTTSSNVIDEYDDFAEFSSPQIFSTKSSSSLNDIGEGVTATNSNNNNNIDDSLFFSSLQLRMQQVQAINNTALPLIILDTMLPRQVLQIQIQHPTLKSLIKHRAITMETPTLGMLGMVTKLSTNTPGVVVVAQQAAVPLKTGVEVEIIQMDKAQAILEGSIGDEMPWDVTLRATERRFVIAGNVTKMESGWTEANVKFFTSAMEEDEEIHPGSSSSSSSLNDRMSVARAISKSRQFTEPNMNMKNNSSLIQRWIELAKLNERIPGQIDTLLQQLGDIPPEYEPSECAFWVGALINPLPGMGVAMEIHQLLSKRAEERVQIALDGILKSIRHMDGTSRMW